jgi:MFS family permease
MGLAYGIAEAVTAIASIIAPIIAGYLYDFDPIVVYPVAAIAIMLGMIATIFLAPKH